MRLILNFQPENMLQGTIAFLCHLLPFLSHFCIASDVIWAVNCGGSGHVDSHGIEYMADPLLTGTSSDYGRSFTISRVPPEDQILYQTERYHTGDFSYNVPVPADGEYVLTLKFSEVWFADPDQKVCLSFTFSSIIVCRFAILPIFFVYSFLHYWICHLTLMLLYSAVQISVLYVSLHFHLRKVCDYNIYTIAIEYGLFGQQRLFRQLKNVGIGNRKSFLLEIY